MFWSMFIQLRLQKSVGTGNNCSFIRRFCQSTRDESFGNVGTLQINQIACERTEP